MFGNEKVEAVRAGKEPYLASAATLRLKAFFGELNHAAGKPIGLAVPTPNRRHIKSSQS